MMVILSYAIQIVHSILLMYSGYAIGEKMRDSEKFHKKVETTHFICDKNSDSNTRLFIDFFKTYLVKIVYEVDCICYTHNVLIYRDYSTSEEKTDLKVMSPKNMENLNIFVEEDTLLVKTTSVESVIGSITLVEL